MQSVHLCKWLAGGVLIGMVVTSVWDEFRLVDISVSNDMMEAARSLVDQDRSFNVVANSSRRTSSASLPVRTILESRHSPTAKQELPTEKAHSEQQVEKATMVKSPAPKQPQWANNIQPPLPTSPTRNQSMLLSTEALRTELNTTNMSRVSTTPHWRGTPLREPKARPPDDDKKHRTGGPVWPLGSAAAYDWNRSVMKLYHVPKRKMGLKEVIFSLDPRRRQPCTARKCAVAHCLAGQPRDMLEVRGLWKSMKHRLFDVMSEERVIFAVMSISASMSGAIDEGSPGFLRANIGAVPPTRLVEPMKYMDVDRALFLDESCTSGKCLSKSAGIVCGAKPLGLTHLYDKRKGVVANICDVQFRRFQTCMNLVREYEKDHENKFTWVTRQRPDVYWTAKSGQVAKLDKKYVYLHAWAACGYGGGDWFYFASRENADVIARFADEFSCQHYKQSGILPSPCKACLGCECSIVAWLIWNKVKFAAAPGPFNDNIPAKFCGGGCPNDWSPKYPYNKKTNLTGYK